MIGQLAKIEPTFGSAYEILGLDPEHPSTATSLNNLAALYEAMGEYAKAEPLYREALRIRQI